MFAIFQRKLDEYFVLKPKPPPSSLSFLDLPYNVRYQIYGYARVMRTCPIDLTFRHREENSSEIVDSLIDDPVSSGPLYQEIIASIEDMIWGHMITSGAVVAGDVTHHCHTSYSMSHASFIKKLQPSFTHRTISKSDTTIPMLFEPFALLLLSQLLCLLLLLFV